MRTNRIVLFASVLLSGIGGCGDNVDLAVRPREQEAIAFVWHQQYGMTTPAPTVAWVEAADLTCVSSDCRLGQCFATELGCRAGLSWPTTTVMQVAWPEGTTGIHQTLAGHEACHLRSLALTGDGDADHRGPCFAPGGYVDQANAALAAKGM